MDKELELAVTNPTEYLATPQTKQNWDMSIEDAGRATSYNTRDVLLAKATQNPKAYSWIKTAITNIGRGIESFFNPDAGAQALAEIYSSPNMPKEKAERLIEDIAYTRYSGRMAKELTKPTGERLGSEKYPITSEFSQGVGQFIAQTVTGLANPTAAWMSVYSASQGQMEENLVDKYIETTGDIRGYADRKRMDDMLVAGFSAFNTAIERGIGAERIIERAFHNPTRVGLKSALEQILNPNRIVGKQLLKQTIRQAGKQALKTGTGELSEEFVQDYLGATTEVAAGYKTLEDLFSDEQLKQALKSGAYGLGIGSIAGFGMHFANRAVVKRRINEWAKKQGIELPDNQLTQMANELIDETRDQAMDQIMTMAEIRNQYGQAYDTIKDRVREVIDATGTTPWTDQNKSKDEYIDALTQTITLPGIIMANKYNMPLSTFIDVAKLTTVPGQPYVMFEPITNIQDIDNLIEEQKLIVKEQTDAKKLGVEKEGLKETAQRRIALLNTLKRNIEREQGITTARSNRKKTQADYITAKDLQPESTGTIETAVQAEEGQEYVMFAGRRIPVEYQVVELAQIQPSHIDGEPNPNYTNVELQNRASRGTVQDVADLREKATNITPERLLRAPTSAEGAPVVNELGEVIAGNGRAEIIRYAYQNSETAEKYRQALTKAGFDTTGMTQPVLVRRNTTMTPDEQVAAAELSNISETSAFDEASQAKRDSQYLKDSATPTEFAAKIPMSERRGLMQNNGKWNNRLVKQRYEDALLSWLTGNDTQLFESLVLDGKIPQKVLDTLVANGALIHTIATKYPDTNLREDIYHALQKMQIASKDNFVELTQQIELDGRDVMPENILIWNWLFADSTTNRQFLSNYATILRQNHESVDNGQDIFGDRVAPLSRKDALMQALKKTDEARAQVAAERGREYEGIFSQETGEVLNAELAAAIASYQNQFAPVAQTTIEKPIYNQALDLTEVIEEIQEKTPDDLAKDIEVTLNNLLNKGVSTATAPLQIQVTEDNKIHVIKSNIKLKGGQLKKHQAALIKLEQLLNNAVKTKEQPVDLSHNTRKKTIAHKQNIEKYVYFNTQIVIGDQLYDVNFATEQPKGQKQDLLDLYNVAVKKNPEAAQLSTLPQGYALIIGPTNQEVKSETYNKKGSRLQGQYDADLQTILLTKYWDETTLVHEMHHRYLDIIWGKFKQAQAGTFQANTAFVEDTRKLFDMLGIDPNQDELTVVQQERFATMVEAYVTGLGVDDQDNLAFQGFLHWVPEKYRSIMDLGYLDEQGRIQNPMLDQASIDFFNRWFASPLVPSLPSAPDAQRMVNVSDDKDEIIPSSQKVMNDREKEWGQDSEIQNKADAQLWKAIGENNPSDLRAGIDGQEEINKEELKNTEDDRILPEKPTLREKWFKARQPNARELAAEKAREYVAKNPEHARELAFADPETLADFDAPVDQGMLIRAVMETVGKGSDEWYILDNNLAMVKSMSGSTLALSGDLSHQAYLDAKREVEAARELKAAVNYAGTRFGAMDKWNMDIRAFAAKRTAAILSTAPNSKEREVAIKAFLEEAKTKFSGNTTNAVLNKLDLTGYQTKSNQVFIKWAEKQIRNVAHAQLDTKEQAELMKASVKAQLALRDIDSRELKDDKYVRAVTAAKDIRHWQFVKDKMKKAYIGRWGRFGIFVDNLFGSYAPSAMLMSVNTLFFANVPSTALNNAIVSRAARLIGDNKVDSKATAGEVQRIKQIFNASGMNLAQMEKPTSPSLMHGEKYTNQEQTHWYNFTFDILSKEDNWFRIPTFVDALARIATRDAKGDTNKATMLFKQYAQLNDQTDEAKIARKEALAVANMAVFTQDGTLASALNHIRSNLNTLSRALLGLDPNGFGLGNILSPFLKTGANVIEMGLTATLAPVRTAAKGLKVLRGKELTDLDKISLTTDWVYLALAAVSTAVLAAISGDDDDWYQEPYQPGQKYDPNKPYDSIRLGNTWIKLDIFGPLEVPLRTAAMLVKNWEDKKLAAVGNGLYEALGEVPLVNQVTDSSADYMAKYPGKWGSSFAYNQLNKLVPAQLKTITRAGSRATGTTADVSALGPTIEKKFHRNYGLDGERLTTNDLLNILTNRLKYTPK